MIFLITLATAVLAIFLPNVSAIEPPRQPYPPSGGGDQLLTFNETVISPVLAAETLELEWVSGDEDGLVVYLSDTTGALTLENFVTQENSTLVPAEDVPADYWEYWIRSDLAKVMFSVSYTKQYRYSYFADYVIYDVESGETTPLLDEGQEAADVQYAAFAPTGETVVFVRGNNLFVKDLESGSITQVTEDGGPDMFHGVPDWVYEEEILGARSSLWFSPDAAFLAFLSFNETGVGTFTIPYFMNDSTIAPPYPRELELRYPKVGTTNPTVMLTLLDLESLEMTPVVLDAFAPEDLIIGEVAWVTATHERMVYRAFNRVQTLEKVVTVSVPDGDSQVNRERDGSDGWLDNMIAIQYVGSVNGEGDYYLDMSDASGWTQIYLFPVDGPAEENVTLTDGEWEVRSVVSIDTGRQAVYYLSTEGHSTESHLYNVSYATGEKEALVDDAEAAYWSASFSSSGGYYLLSYSGPDVPYQELFSLNSTTEPLRTVTSNAELVANLTQYALPNISYTEIGPVPDTSYTLNTQIQLPPSFDPSRKYPVLFTPYGGPGAQEVSKRSVTPSWNQYISSDPELEYITVTIDNRGTGYKGRAFRATVTEQLGVLEAQDQIWAADYLCARYEWMDAKHVAMWGWSYGGFLTGKVLEAQGEEAGPFALGLLTAPVSDWRFYDTMYTERYMRTPELNPEGYNVSAISQTAGFKNVPGGFAIMHGTGDDNVHYQNTAALLDLLVGDGISPEKADWRAFTDSDHSIVYNGDDVYLYKYLTMKLWEERGREVGLQEQHQWSKREVLDLAGR